jgi:hypothetical protein
MAEIRKILCRIKNISILGNIPRHTLPKKHYCHTLRRTPHNYIKTRSEILSTELQTAQSLFRIPYSIKHQEISALYES